MLPLMEHLWCDRLEKGMATHFSILALRIPWTGAWQSTVQGVAESDMTERLTHTWSVKQEIKAEVHYASISVFMSKETLFGYKQNLPQSF